MEALLFLVPLSILVSLVVICVGFWANKTGQYDQMDTEWQQGFENEDIIEKDN